MQQNNTFDGIDVKPTPTANPDGSYTVKLSPAQWAKFQENQANPPQPKSAPVEDSDPSSISVSKAPSKFK